MNDLASLTKKQVSKVLFGLGVKSKTTAQRKTWTNLL